MPPPHVQPWRAGLHHVPAEVRYEPGTTRLQEGQFLEGGRYVLSHKLLIAISFCAIFWNLAFAALLVVLVPAIREIVLTSIPALLASPSPPLALRPFRLLAVGPHCQ